MSTRHSGVQAVAVLATVLALAACGSAVDEEPSVSVGPTAPTESDDDPTGSAEPAETGAETTGPAATGADPTTTGADPTTTSGEGATTGGVTTGDVTTGGATTGGATTEDVTTQDGPAGEAGATDEPSGLPEFEAADAVVRQDPGGEAAQLVIDEVRLGLQDDFDRVVLDLSGTGEAGWLVQYAEAPAMDGSGFPVDLAGDHVLQVVAQGMAYPEPGDTAYDPGLLLVDGGDLLQVTEVLRGAPFEGQVQVLIGTQEQAPFRVFRLAGPERLVIDLQH
ncbi:AMIN domain-containing protein [Ornithinimicrobium cryptoxanthini]|uniref:AMIN domain-containing protein n=1 Tax=Ornithinimicrobium cryptoxanthini TaxID=2934161 RepID=A0ABY4YKV9_9MICO|nr:AMIN domain-containing protein [Ornithinimicrobium cryptoxanthini]USQ77422.1 AMIN domain-containing protein [Ornithinimicrobium cryptoxanthini]